MSPIFIVKENVRFLSTSNLFDNSAINCLTVFLKIYRIKYEHSDVYALIMRSYLRISKSVCFNNVKQLVYISTNNVVF